MHAGLGRIVENVWRLHHRYASADWLVSPSAPVLYFGDRGAYEKSSLKVITVGLNPSRHEFPSDDPYRRFPRAKSDDPDGYVAALNGYFRTRPYDAWFKPAFESFLNGLECSYYGGLSHVALHTDICSPLPTNPTWSGLSPSVREELQGDGVALWHDLVRCLQPDVIVISVARKYLDLVEFPMTRTWRTAYTIERATPYVVQSARVEIGGRKRAHVVFGRASQLPFGSISNAAKRSIGAWMKNSWFNRRDKQCFVQFLHPGGEHPIEGDVQGWNQKAHKRKFMLAPGCCTRGHEKYKGDLVFWGEWEAHSEVVEQIAEPLPAGPRAIVRPFYVVPKSYCGLQNTDPFVFDGFFYTGCQQRTIRGPTQLRYLKVGSVVLFGSCVGKSEFALDTAFVVDDWIEHDRHNWRQTAAPHVPAVYRDVTLAAWYQPLGGCCSEPDDSFRLYFGATHENPLAGMYSFFPCRPYRAGSRGFARPVIRMPGVITGSCLQGKKLNPQPNLAAVGRLWKEVVKQVEAQGCWLGVRAEPPVEQESVGAEKD